MKEYRIEFKQDALKALRVMPEIVYRNIQEAVLALRAEPFPHGYEKMRGYAGYYRIRVGKYRILYHVSTKIRVIIIIRVLHRKDVYKNL